MNSDNKNAKHLGLVVNWREELKQQVREKQGWYFITLVRDLPSDRPYGFTLSNEPFVLFKDKNDKLICYLLSSSNEKNSNVTLSPFKVMKKQGEIWFWRGKV